MAASTMPRASSFGHYLLPLTMNKGHINAKQAEYHIRVKTKYLDIKKHRPERHALRNLLGILHFRLGKFDESLEFFDKILSDGEDPKNLNALANQKYICNKLYRIPESRDCEKKISELLPDDYQNEGEESRLRRARSLAEQAFAYSFDVFDESVTTERYRTSVKLYDEAFELAGDSLAQYEREDWMTSKGMACHKIFNKVKWDKSLKEEAQTWLGKMANIFIQIVQETDDNSLASEGWRQLGEIFQQAKSHYFNPIQVPDSLKKYLSTPGKCFKRALHYTPNDPRLLARFANFLKKIRNKEEALERVNQSIQLDASMFNYFAYSVRGQIFLQDYEKQKRMSANQFDKLLENAQNDFEKASKIHVTPVDLEHLAQVYYYLAIDCHGNEAGHNDGQRYHQKALTTCARAAACQDGEQRSLVHKIRGQSLCALGEHQQALRSFQRAIECKDNMFVVENSVKLLVVEYSHVLNDVGDTLLNHKPLLADMVYWLHKAAKLRLTYPEWKSYSMIPPMSLTSQWQSFVKFCQDNDYIWELEDIQQASRDPRGRRTQQRRTVSTSDAESMSRPSHVRHSKSVPEERSGARFEDSNPHALLDESATDSLSVFELDGNKTSSKAKEDKSTMTLRTGEDQVSDQTSSSQEWTTDDASNKPIRSAPGDALNCDFTYDFFVIHSDSASEWVFRCLLEELEGRGLKGCIKDRDFMLGQTKVKNYTGSTANSACVLIVVSKDFKKDYWCDRGMEMAFEQRKLLIPILREDTELPALLNPLTHLDALGAVNWERLQKCIEQHIKLDDAAA
ncbi:uncharacterized protein [Asterias amurensis]|uniref:uncharacterized protein n=1 Tax=Asterias amurensis TaxID=7602 RepID=UPI003AB7217E